jgi:hypothetical protein
VIWQHRRATEEAGRKRAAAQRRLLTLETFLKFIEADDMVSDCTIILSDGTDEFVHAGTSSPIRQGGRAQSWA